MFRDNTFFHLHVTHSENYRIDFAETYVLGQSVEQVNFNSTIRQPTLTSTSAFQDRGTVYAAAHDKPTGQVVTVHGVEHFTWIETDGVDGPTEGDIYKASVDNVRVTCR